MGILAVAAPLAKALAPIVIAKLGERANLAQTNAITDSIKQEIAHQIASNPVLRNELNAEPWWQSRTGWGAIIASIGVLLPPILRIVGVDISENDILRHGDAILTLGGALYAIYGRFWPGLPPLFSRKG